MKPIITAAACFLLIIHLPGHSYAKNWHVEFGGSWCVARWDNEVHHWEETTTRAYKATVSGSYGVILLQTEYTRGSFEASTPSYECDVNRDDILVFLGHRFLTNPSMAPCLTYGHIKDHTEADVTSYGGGDYDEETFHRFYGFGLLASQAFGTTGVTVFGKAMYSPWGTWTSERHEFVPPWGPYELELEADSPACYGGELGIGYRLRWFNALVEASWAFLNQQIDYDYPGTSLHYEHDERWQRFALGLSYEF